MQCNAFHTYDERIRVEYYKAKYTKTAPFSFSLVASIKMNFILDLNRLLFYFINYASAILGKHDNSTTILHFRSWKHMNSLNFIHFLPIISSFVSPTLLFFPGLWEIFVFFLLRSVVGRGELIGYVLSSYLIFCF